jgi:hypothetical protein
VWTVVRKDGKVGVVTDSSRQKVQSASPRTSHELIAPKTGITLPGYLPKIGSILGFSQRLLSPFSPIAIKSKTTFCP